MSVIYLKGKSSMMKNYLYNSSKIPKCIKINDEKISRKDKIIIAGPCTFGSYKEAYNIANEIKKMGINFFRAGAYKGRTNPYSYQGMQDEGIEILLKIKKELNINIVTELMTIEQVKKYGKHIDIIQVGSRNMYNYELLKELGKINKPILLKRGFMATYEEWLLAAEYILDQGNYNTPPNIRKDIADFLIEIYEKSNFIAPNGFVDDDSTTNTGT